MKLYFPWTNYEKGNNFAKRFVKTGTLLLFLKKKSSPAFSFVCVCVCVCVCVRERERERERGRETETERGIGGECLGVAGGGDGEPTTCRAHVCLINYDLTGSFVCLFGWLPCWLVSLVGREVVFKRRLVACLVRWLCV